MRYEWTGEERVIPALGVFRKGDIVELPVALAASLLQQKLVKIVEPVKPQKEE